MSVEPEDFAAFWSGLSRELPPLLDEARHHLAKARWLLADLLGRPDRLEALREERFHTPFLVELLLEASQQIQTLSPEHAELLAGLAAGLTAHLQDGGPTEEELFLWRTRAAILTGNARRLLGRWPQAEEAFRSAAVFLQLTWHGVDTAAFCRAFGLLRWEQGRLEEAEALLRQGARTFRELGLCAEAGASRVLLGLLSLERDRPDRAVRLLRGGLLGLDPNARPWLAVRGALGLALALAETDQAERAAILLEEIRKKRTQLDARELLRADWLEGRIMARLGMREHAASLLESVRLRLHAEPSLPEDALCALDLAAAQEKTPASRQQAIDTAAALRRMYRLRGDRVEGLPFA